jgi:hypothetical protein
VLGNWHDMLYHAGLGQVVLVNGGPETGKPVDDPLELWGWDGGGWRLLSAEGPRWRNFAAVAYDAGRGVLVLYGGLSGDGQELDETWEWDGRDWRQSAAPGPGGREAPGMAYDSARGTVVLFGGARRGQPQGDTWTWDGVAWTRQAALGPAARFPGAFVFDPLREVVWLFGGHRVASSGWQTYGDTWAWDGSGWAEFSVPGPSPRDGPRGVFDPAAGRVLLFGGAEIEPAVRVLADTWAWDGAAWTELAAPGPPGRVHASLAYDVARRQVLLAGGANQAGAPPLADVWAWDGSGWICRLDCPPAPAATPVPSPTVAVQEPIACSGHDLAFAPPLQMTLLVNCGREDPAAPPEPMRLWGWDGSVWQLLAADGPLERALGGVAYDTLRSRLIIYGGRGPTQDFTDMWTWDGQAWQALEPTGGILSNHFAMVYDPDRDRLVAYGGQTLQGVVQGDTWEWDGAAWQRVARTGPALRVHYALTYDSARRQVLLFGEGPDELWAWRGGPRWEHLPAASGPPTRGGARMAYHAATGQVVLMGGYVYGPNGYTLGDTWLWDGARWTEYTGPGPTPRSHHALAYDPDREVIVLYGGYAGGTSNLDDTWEWDGAQWTCVDRCP